jgi:N-acetylglucosamine-6-phosphate deacetylase
VRVVDGVVSEVGPLDEASEALQFDVLAPGFCDLQVNGIGPIDVAVADGDDWAELGRSLLAQGVTTWCPTLVTAPDGETRTACSRIAAAMKALPPGNPDIAGAHLEGPFITETGAHRKEYVMGRVDPEWAARLDPVVRLVTLAPELPGATAAIPRLCEQGILVSLGHSACTAEVAHEAISLGARLVTHLGNASGALHQRAPGLFGAALCDDRVAVSLIADLEHVHPDILSLAFKAKGSRGVVLVTDSVATDAATVGPVKLTSGPPGAAARLADGTLAGSALTMDRAISNVVARAGASLEEAVEAASTNPARLLGLADRGSIAPGMRADLVALKRSGESSPAAVEPATVEPVTVEAVWVAGRLSWPTR